MLHEQTALGLEDLAANRDDAAGSRISALDRDRHGGVARGEARSPESPRPNGVLNDEGDRLRVKGGIQATDVVALARMSDDRSRNAERRESARRRPIAAKSDCRRGNRRNCDERDRVGKPREQSSDVRDERNGDEWHLARSLVHRAGNRRIIALLVKCFCLVLREDWPRNPRSLRNHAE